ncbi:hypothetical protein, partial [Flavobacterium sp.]|uniref:hypothetical protein n=1 Tax=Flavobacterium sp. TaxID=239 RepID=UPI0025BAC96E
RTTTAEKNVVAINGPIWNSTKTKTAVENAFYHWEKHGKEFPELLNAKQYVEYAHEFFKSKNALVKIRPKGEIIRYDLLSNTYGTFTKNGVPKTMFKPKQGIVYFQTRN